MGGPILGKPHIVASWIPLGLGAASLAMILVIRDIGMRDNNLFDVRQFLRFRPSRISRYYRINMRGFIQRCVVSTFFDTLSSCVAKIT